MPETPSIKDIRAACGSRVFDRAEEILQAPLLVGRTRCGEAGSAEMFARCHGSQGGIYTLRARLEDGQVAESSCSCPFDGRGLCKHRVALLLAHAREPDSFAEWPALSVMLAECSIENLRGLVAAMVRREPGLLPLLGASRGTGDDFSPAVLKRALSGRDASDGEPVIEAAFELASRREADGDFFGAGEVYAALVNQLAHAATHFEQAYNERSEWDEYGEEEAWNFGDDWANQAAEGLARCFSAGPLAPEAKEKWTRQLWEAEQAAEECEYFGLPDVARELLAAHAPDDLWADIEATVRARLAQTKSRPPMRGFLSVSGGLGEFVEVPVGDDYERKRGVEFLLLRAKSRGGSGDELIAQLGTTDQKFDLAMRDRDFERAARIARGFLDTPHSLLRCATRLDEAGEGSLALELARRVEAGDPTNNTRHARFQARADAVSVWLADFFARHKDAANARTYAVRVFAAEPDARNFARLREAVQLSGPLDEEHEVLEREVRAVSGKNWQGGSREGEVALWLAIHAGRAERALELLGKQAKSERPRFLEAVAQTCEEPLPNEALKLWRELAEWHIEHRESNARRSYQEAAKYLRHVRALHQTLGAPGEWSEYIATLRGVYKPLRALQDELNKAGL